MFQVVWGLCTESPDKTPMTKCYCPKPRYKKCTPQPNNPNPQTHKSVAFHTLAFRPDTLSIGVHCDNLVCSTNFALYMEINLCLVNVVPVLSCSLDAVSPAAAYCSYCSDAISLCFKSCSLVFVTIFFHFLLEISLYANLSFL